MSKYPRLIVTVNAHTNYKIYRAASLVCPGTEFAVLTLHGTQSCSENIGNKSGTTILISNAGKYFLECISFLLYAELSFCIKYRALKTMTKSQRTQYRELQREPPSQ